MKKIAFYFNTIKRSGSEIALLRYLKLNKNNTDSVLIYSNFKETDSTMIDEYKKYIDVHLVQNEKAYETIVAVNCSIYDVDEELFINVKAKKYVFWAQVNPNNMPILNDKRKLEKYNTFLATSEYIRDALIEKNEYTKDKIYVANPIICSKEILEMSNESQRLIDNKTFNIITIARYTPSKGYQYNIEIAKKLKNMGVNFKWYNFGFVHKSREEFYREINNKIKKYDLSKQYILKDNCKNPYKYLARSNLNVLFSKDEAWGLVISEAKVLGVPNIASNNSAIKEQIINNVNGYLVDIPSKESDIDNIANKIKYLYENEYILNKMKENLKLYTQDEENIVAIMNKCFGG